MWSLLGHGAVLGALVWLAPGAVGLPERAQETLEFAVVTAEAAADSEAGTATGPRTATGATPATASGGAPPRRVRSAPAVGPAPTSGDPFAIDGVAVPSGSTDGTGAPPGPPAAPAPEAAGAPGGSALGPGAAPTPRTAGVDAGAVRRAVQRALRYPKLARDRGVEGTVVLRFRIDDAGRARELEVVASGGALLDEAAREAVERAQPFASPPGGVRIPVVFELEGGSAP